MDVVLWVEQLDEDAIPIAGSKVARLGALRRAGLTVPDGFAVTTMAYDHFLRSNDLARQIDERLGAIDDLDSLDEVEQASAEIRRRIEITPIPPDVGEPIADAYDELSYRCYDLNVPVAVRSSATGEDAADASFAGQFDTYLGMSGRERVLDAVRRCWSSLFSARALGYRLRKGLDHHDSPMAVGVVELVHARASGVAFSIHPVTGKRDRMVIEGSWGWGEAVVQGLVMPDHVEVGKADRRVLRYDVGHKEVVSAFDYAAGMVVEHEMPRRLVDARALDDEQVGAVVAAVLQIEEHYGNPVDVEWVLGRHRRVGEPVTIVQTRPVTVADPIDAGSTGGWDPVAYAAKYAYGRERR
jgi:phosphoenolpyruvate synthase/pyruvate phosphate dikinase